MVPTALTTYWWTIPLLLALALRAGLVEEVIAVGYLFARLKQLGMPMWGIIATQALLRGTYHLYQGFGAFIGNVIMGLIFGWIYSRTHRLAPLIVGHTLQCHDCNTEDQSWAGGITTHSLVCLSSVGRFSA